MKLKLHQFLSRTGAFESKRNIFEAIKNEEIKVDSETITNPYYDLNPNSRSVYYKDKKLETIKDKIYIILNKPEGYLSSRLAKKDIEFNKKSLFDLIKMDEKIKKTLFCVGRLDEDSCGLIIITNDGHLSSMITDPKNKIQKVYDVTLKKPITNEDIKKIENGILIDLEENGRITKYKTKECMIQKKTENRLKITIEEGKKREIRRMFEAVQNKVEELQRISIGNLNLKALNLRKGNYLIADKNFIEQGLK